MSYGIRRTRGPMPRDRKRRSDDYDPVSYHDGEWWLYGTSYETEAEAREVLAKQRMGGAA